MALPTAVEPVNATLLTFGCAESVAPVFPAPLTILITPFGTPASVQSCAKNMAVRGVDSAGFRTIEFPIAIAGAIFHASIKNGKFHGIICATTPTGS